MLPLLAIGAISLGLLSLWLQAKAHPQRKSLRVSILAIATAVAFFVAGLSYPEPFHRSYRIAWIFVSQIWIIAQALLRIRTTFSTDRSVFPYAAAAGISILPYFLIHEILPRFFATSLENPNTYIEISLFLSTASIAVVYGVGAWLFPIAQSRQALFKHYLVKALARAAMIQLVDLIFLLLYAYLLKQSEYWAAKLLATPITFGAFATYVIGKWFKEELPDWAQEAQTETEMADATQQAPSIIMTTSTPPLQNQKRGKP